MNTSQYSTIENAKTIVSVLNELKAQSYTFSILTDLSKKLREKNCPYASVIPSYLNRQKYIVQRGGWYTFIDRKPFDYYNFICVVDRIKSKNNKNSRGELKKSESVVNKLTELNSHQKYVKQYSKWTRFWVKSLFKINL